VEQNEATHRRLCPIVHKHNIDINSQVLPATELNSSAHNPVSVSRISVMILASTATPPMLVNPQT